MQNFLKDPRAKECGKYHGGTTLIADLPALGGTPSIQVADEDVMRTLDNLLSVTPPEFWKAVRILGDDPIESHLLIREDMLQIFDPRGSQRGARRF